MRVIGPEGNQLGIIPLDQALKQAEAAGLDLVEVAPEAQPPVCRILDYGKFRYTQKKKEHGSRKRQSFVTVKEVKVGSRTDAHDLVFKVRNIRRFIERGERVRVSVLFRGREITHTELGREMLNGVFTQVQDVARLDGAPRMEGRSMAMLLSPK